MKKEIVATAYEYSKKTKGEKRFERLYVYSTVLYRLTNYFHRFIIHYVSQGSYK